MKISVFLTILASVTSALAGCNCKCQDPSGTGPQWDDLTEQVCDMQNDESSLFCIETYHGNQHHQCSAPNCCIDSGDFDKQCKILGAPGAYCWK
ncbi:hypothetical protein NEUTE1DRAFT_39997 [Neurospora tetrasperma FGSC 2508]|uniref:Uncharacterized protein n=1 Tax=Neurospora tetrasperma (strain FGSC 2508 / ATCC MYA-4615 / P0657) TaxID=510951 RepID=F8MIV4_NEUT8|nr:uncharacterized protein NEUTE1DRAFT_39997 [Neurospora tetrasperma FGSC 2508]EGO59851.1 hypothetical protein NEUTE1DRAFT_39997 [Neurospora tetrasperma FGSC 2508]EGZ74000.1 hypothetical protein NEUTE2DRAFT_128347 [Neurospora tetrasperma FGSC 2509]